MTPNWIDAYTAYADAESDRREAEAAERKRFVAWTQGRQDKEREVEAFTTALVRPVARNAIEWACQKLAEERVRQCMDALVKDKRSVGMSAGQLMEEARRMASHSTARAWPASWDSLRTEPIIRIDLEPLSYAARIV